MTKYKHFGPRNVRQTEQEGVGGGGGARKGVKTMDSEKGVGG